MRKHDTEIQQLKGELEEDRHNRKLTPNERVRKLHELQGLLVDSITVDDLVWGWIGLKMGERRSSRTSDYRIEVCQPVRIAGLRKHRKCSGKSNPSPGDWRARKKRGSKKLPASSPRFATRAARRREACGDTHVRSRRGDAASRDRASAARTWIRWGEDATNRLP